MFQFQSHPIGQHTNRVTLLISYMPLNMWDCSLHTILCKREWNPSTSYMINDHRVLAARWLEIMRSVTCVRISAIPCVWYVYVSIAFIVCWLAWCLSVSWFATDFETYNHNWMYILCVIWCMIVCYMCGHFTSVIRTFNCNVRTMWMSRGEQHLQYICYIVRRPWPSKNIVWNKQSIQLWKLIIAFR